MSGDSSFENTARVVRARLDPIAKLILAQLTDGVVVSKTSGAVTLPEWSIPEIAQLTGYSVTTVQRRLKVLESVKLVRRFVRPGRAYVFQPLVSQLPLSMAAAAQQPPLLPDATATVTMQAQPARAVRGARGRFITAQDFHNPSQSDRGPVEKSTGVPAQPSVFPLTWIDASPESDRVTPVRATGDPGQSDRTPRSERPGFDAHIGIQTTDQTKTQIPAAVAAALPLMGVPLTPEQRRALATEPAADHNYGAILAFALHLGREPVEARRYLAVPIAEEGDLREATKRACDQTDIKYNLTTTTGEGVLHAAVQVAWRKLTREGVLRDRSSELSGTKRRRRR